MKGETQWSGMNWSMHGSKRKILHGGHDAGLHGGHLAILGRRKGGKRVLEYRRKEEGWGVGDWVPGRERVK